MPRHLIPAGVHVATQVIERSRFTCKVAHAPDAAAAHAFIRSVQSEWPDATHHCNAWVAGPPGSTTHIGMSDDGEPHGTAGRPMLNVLLHSGIGEIVAVVTRWYGGVKLGTGGLARAYSSSVELALATLPTIERIDWVQLAMTVGYQHISAIQRLLPEYGAVIDGEEYGEGVRYRIRVPDSRHDPLITAIADATRGEAMMESLQ